MRQVDEGRGMPECRQSGACQGFGVVNRRLRAPLARDEAICRCPSWSKARSWPRTAGNLANVGLEPQGLVTVRHDCV